jgi:hypothetical protein
LLGVATAMGGLLATGAGDAVVDFVGAAAVDVLVLLDVNDDDVRDVDVEVVVNDLRLASRMIVVDAVFSTAS